jgi:hypothetical protein
VPTYLVSGTALTTDLPLPELPLLAPDDEPARAWALVLADHVDATVDVVEFEHRTRDGRLWCRVGSGDGVLVLEFPGKLDVVVRTADHVAELAVARGLATSTLRHLVIDQLVPHLLRADGEVVLHASAVALDGAALAFLGPSGSGKSSLAGGFVRAGAELLADDFLVVREQEGCYTTTAAYPGLRLWPDSAAHLAGDPGLLAEVADYNDKQRWAVAPRAPGTSVPLAALLVLGDAPQDDADPVCQLGVVHGGDAFTLLYGQAFRAARSGRAGQEAELDWFVRLARRVPVVLVEHRRAYDVLPEVVAEIRAALGRLPPAPVR